MKAPSVTLLPLVLLTLLAGVTFWLERTTQFGASSQGKALHNPDFFVDNFVVRRYNLAGDVQHTLTAKQMRHYPDDDTTEVDAPNLTYHDQPQPTRISARQAWISKDGKELRLIDDVRILRAASPGNPELRVTTSELSVLPDSEQASTHKPVTIVNGRSEIHGNGLKADNRARLYTMHGRVQGTIHRNPSKTP